VSYVLLLGALYWMESAFAELHWVLTTIAWAPQYPWLLGALFLGVLSIAARARAAIVASTVAALFAAGVLMGPAFSLHPAAGNGAVVRLLTLNAGTGRTGPAGLRKLLREARPDVVCLQEAATLLAASGNGSTIEVDGEEFLVVRDRELAILSRLPILRREVHALGFGTGRSVLEVRVQAGEQELTVLATHFFRGRARGDAGTVSRALADLTRSGQIHSLQTERLLEIAAQAPEPHAIAGDLNLPPRGRLYRRLTTDHTDAFRAAGRGYGYSFPGSLPMVRIDYVLPGRGVTARRCRTLSTAGSDHRAVLAELALG
jgi:vancomycin resistance protein VanJ